MFYEDRYRFTESLREKLYRYKITEKLKQKYKLDYNDMTPIAYEDNQWIKSDNILDRRSTDDGCEHYLHINGTHYILNYKNGDEWFIYEYKEKKKISLYEKISQYINRIFY